MCLQAQAHMRTDTQEGLQPQGASQPHKAGPFASEFVQSGGLAQISVCVGHWQWYYYTFNLVETIGKAVRIQVQVPTLSLPHGMHRRLYFKVSLLGFVLPDLLQV